MATPWSGPALSAGLAALRRLWSRHRTRGDEPADLVVAETEHLAEDGPGVLTGRRREGVAMSPRLLQEHGVAHHARAPAVAAFELGHHPAMHDLRVDDHAVDGVDDADRNAGA